MFQSLCVFHIFNPFKIIGLHLSCKQTAKQFTCWPHEWPMCSQFRIAGASPIKIMFGPCQILLAHKSRDVPEAIINSYPVCCPIEGAQIDQDARNPVRRWHSRKARTKTGCLLPGFGLYLIFRSLLAFSLSVHNPIRKASFNGRNFLPCMHTPSLCRQTAYGHVPVHRTQRH